MFLPCEQYLHSGSRGGSCSWKRRLRPRCKAGGYLRGRLAPLALEGAYPSVGGFCRWRCHPIKACLCVFSTGGILRPYLGFSAWRLREFGFEVPLGNRSENRKKGPGEYGRP